MSSGTKQRASNYELLRIIAILFITFNHINTYCDVRAIGAAWPANLFLSFFIGAGGKFGCNVFLLISAWFLAVKGPKASALFRIFLQTFFYLFLLDVVYLVVSGGGITAKSFASQILRTLIGKNYWYSFAYFILLLMIPVLRSLMDVIPWKKLFLGVVGLLICVLPTLTADYLLIPGSAGKMLHRLFSMGMYENVVWFWYVFCVVYYLRQYAGFRARLRPVLGAVLFIASYLAMVLVSYGTYLYANGHEGRVAAVLAEQYNWVRNSYSLLCILAAAGLFLWLHAVRMKVRPWINRFGPYIFGIYLLQTHPLMRTVLYTKIFDFESIYLSSPPWRYFLTACLLVVLILAIGLVIEFVRLRLEGKLFAAEWMKRLTEGTQNFLGKIYRRLPRRVS